MAPLQHSGGPRPEAALSQGTTNRTSLWVRWVTLPKFVESGNVNAIVKRYFHK